MKSIEILGNCSSFADTGCGPGIVTQLDFTSIYAQFISITHLQNIETLQKILLLGKWKWRAFSPIQSFGEKFKIRPSEKVWKIFYYYDVRAFDIR